MFYTDMSIKSRFLMSPIPSGKWSTGALMRAIIPIALQLVLFEGVWWMILMPPVALAVLTCNLGLLFMSVRPRSWETRIVGMMLGGTAAAIASALFYVLGDFLNRSTTVLGTLVRDGLGNWASSLTDQSGGLATVLYLLIMYVTQIEAGVVVILGVAVIWAGGSLDHWCRGRWARYREARPMRPSRAEHEQTTTST